MRRIGLLALAAFILCGGSAFANENEGWLVQCTFKSDIKGASVCHAQAKLFKDDDRGEHNRNQLGVFCDGELVYEDGVRVDVKHDKIILEGKESHLFPNAPTIVYAKPDHLPDLVSAWLLINGFEARGFCKVKEVEHHE